MPQLSLSLDPGILSPEIWVSALGSLRAGKAVPAGQPSVQQWRDCSYLVADRLSHIARDALCCSDSKVPTEWSTVQLARLAKAGKTPSRPQNLKSIGLMSADSKAFLNVLRSAIAPYVEAVMHDQPQYAYRKGASTSDALMRAAGHCSTVRMLLQRHHNDQTSKLLGDASIPCAGGLMCGLDLQKAFDALPHSELYAAMIDAGVPDSLAATITQAHVQTRCVVRHGGEEREEFHAAVRELRLLIEALRSLEMSVNFQKSVVVLRLCGRAVGQLRKSYLVWRSGVQHLRIRCTDNDMYIPCATQMPYLGAELSYDNFELKTFKGREKQAIKRVQELRRVLRTNGSITVRHRVRIYKAIVWPTLWYALSSVGITTEVLRGVCSVLAGQLRKVFRVYKEGVSNKLVLQQAGLDPRGFFLWQVQQQGQCIQRDLRRADHVKAQESRHCQNVHQRLLGIEDNPSMTSLVRIPKVDAVAVTCPCCGVSFDSQASLQMHIKHKHSEINKSARLAFHRDLHALHGLPICRFCQARLHDWRSLEKHITEGTCPRAKVFVSQGLGEATMLRRVCEEEQKHSPPVPHKAMPQSQLENDIGEALKFEPSTLNSCGDQLLILATRCALCRQLIPDSSNIKIHWQRTHAQEWAKYSADAISGTGPLTAGNMMLRSSRLRCFMVSTSALHSGKLRILIVKGFKFFTLEDLIDDWHRQVYMHAFVAQAASGPPSEVSTAATAEEREAKAVKTENKGGRGKGGGKKEWSWPGNWKDSGSSGDWAEMQEMQKLMTLMQKLVLRHEDSINLLKLEYSFVAHMKLNEPQKLDRPMRTSLFVCFWAELKTRIQAMDANPSDVDKLAELGWVVKGPPLTWHCLKWDPAAQRSIIDTNKPPLTNADVLENIDTILANAVTTNSLARFHPTRPLGSIVFLIQVGNFGDASLSIRTSLKSLCYNAALQLVAAQLKEDELSRLMGLFLYEVLFLILVAGSLTAFVRFICDPIVQWILPLQSCAALYATATKGATLQPLELGKEAVCQGVSAASGSELGGSVPLVVGGVFMVGAQPPTSYELDLRYEYARQHVYLLRNVRVGDLQERPGPQTDANTCASADSKQFTVGAWNFGNMAGVVNNTVTYPWVTWALAGILG
ncbi:unnamed protein product, partial [Symbiodinium sp. KB8]